MAFHSSAIECVADPQCQLVSLIICKSARHSTEGRIFYFQTKGTTISKTQFLYDFFLLIIQLYSFKIVFGFSADHASTHMHSNIQVHWHMSAEKPSAHTLMYSHKGMTSHMCVRQLFGECSEVTDSQDKVLMVSNTEISKVEMDGCFCVSVNGR